MERVVPLLAKHGGEVLVADRQARQLEGAGGRVRVVLRFATEEAARRWHDHPEDAPVRDVRLAACSDHDVSLALGVVPPGS